MGMRVRAEDLRAEVGGKGGRKRGKGKDSSRDRRKRERGRERGRKWEEGGGFGGFGMSRGLEQAFLAQSAGLFGSGSCSSEQGGLRLSNIYTEQAPARTSSQLRGLLVQPLERYRYPGKMLYSLV